MPDDQPRSPPAARPERRSGFLFDPIFYLAANPDLAVLAERPGFDAEEHFWAEGIWDGREPSAAYSIEHLQRTLKHAGPGLPARAQVLPLFFALPPAARPIPNAWFNPALFRRRCASDHPEIAGLADFPLFEFYLANGGPLALSPNGLFDEAGYQAQNPDVALQVLQGRIDSGFQHFIARGWEEGRTVIPGRPAGTAPAASRWPERDAVLAPGAAAPDLAWWFDEGFYLAVNHDVHALRRAGAFSSGLEHFLVEGFAEGRVPHPALFRAFREPPTGAELDSLLRSLGPVDRAPGRTLPLDQAAALRLLALERGWATDEAALTGFLWDFVAPPELPGSFDAEAYISCNPDIAALIGAGAFPDAASHWRQEGMRAGRRAPFTEIFAGRRASLREIARREPGVNYIGPVSLRGEAGGATRDMLAALEAAGLAVAALDVSFLFDEQERLDLVAADDLPFAFTVVDLPPERILPLVARFGAALFDRRLTIALWECARTAAPPDWRAVLSGFDLVLAPDQASADALTACTGRTVLVAPRPLDAGRLRRLAEAGRHPMLDRLRGEQADGRRVVLFTMEGLDDSGPRGLDCFLALARRLEAAEPGAYRFCIKATARSAAGPGLAPAISDAPVLLIDEAWGEAEQAALRACADLAVFPDRAGGAQLDALATIALGTPALVAAHGGAAEILGDRYPLLLAGRPAEAANGAVWFEPDLDDAVGRVAAHFRGGKRFTVWSRRVAQTLAPDRLGPVLRALLAEHGGIDQRLDRLGDTLEAAVPQCLALPERPEGLRLRAAVAGALAPLFTIVTIVREARPEALEALHRDLLAQDCPAWEWCLEEDGAVDASLAALLVRLKQDDARVTVGRSGRGGAVAAANAAVLRSAGRFLFFLAAEDRIAPDMLSAFAARIAAADSPDLLYCDEDRQDGGDFLRPDWAPEHLLAEMYLGRAFCLRKSRFCALSGLRPETAGAELHDLVLRAAASGARVAHLDRKLLLVAAPTPASEAAGLRAVRDHLRALGLAGDAEPGLLPGTFRARPLITAARASAVILSGCGTALGPDGPVLHLERFLRSILDRPPALRLAIDLVVDRGREPVIAHLAGLDPAIRIVPYDPPADRFNFAAKANHAVRAARDETVILLNDDMEALDDAWVPALLEPLELPGVGITGARLLYADRRVQHAGIVLGVNGASTHLFAGLPGDEVGYNRFTHLMRNYAAVTAACMAFRRADFDRIGGFDERFAVDFNDTDFCLRMLRAGLRVVYTPFARLLHHESQTVSRARADTLETRAFTRRWHALVARDPYYNVNFGGKTPAAEPGPAAPERDASRSRDCPAPGLPAAPDD